MASNSPDQAATETQQSVDAKPLAAKSGYYYAHNQMSAADRPLVGATTIYNHTPLCEESVKKIERQNSGNGQSLWNSGGTWEEKDFSKWAESRIKETMPSLKTQKGLVVFTEVKSVDDCHASIVHSRGKKKASIEIDKLKIGYKAADGEGKGVLEIRDFSSNSPDDMVLNIKADKKAAAADQALIEADLKNCKGPLKAYVQTLMTELSAK